jgi:acyl-CoA thioesterase-1
MHPMKTLLIIFAFIVVSCSRDIKIACVGDSITEGSGLVNQSRTAYPVRLDSILGKGYSVINFGRSAATLQKKGDLPYWECKEFYDVFAFNPDIIIIKLGTNDTKRQNWNYENFTKDYQALIDTFNTISGKPKIFVCLPVPVFKTMWGINDSTLTTAIIPIIKETAKKNNLPVIDLYHTMSDQEENFPDAIHPNEKAAKIMAGIIASEIKK